MSKSENPKKSYKRKRLIIYILLGICIAATIVSAVGLGIEMYTTRRAQVYYADLTSDVPKRPLPPGGLAITPPPSTAAPTEDEPDAEIEAEEEDPWEPYVNFDDLNERFQGITAAWLYMENSVIDYPVMQAVNNSYFLSRLPDGTNHRNGSLFMDYRNNPQFLDKNILIYGHNMRSGDMFGILNNYRNQEFYEQHPVMFLFTPEKDYALVLFAGYILDSAVEVPPIRFSDENAFLSHIANIKRRSVFRSDVEVAADDRIVSLCTCNYNFVNARMIVVGKLVDLGPY